MPDIKLITEAPLVAQITFSDLELRALTFDATQTNTTVAALFAERTAGYIEAAVRRYKEARANAFFEKFDAGTADQQQAAIDAVGGLPSTVA